VADVTSIAAKQHDQRERLLRRLDRLDPSYKN